MTTDEAKAAAVSIPELKMRKAPDFKSHYVNWAQTTFSPFDISLLVAEFSPLEQGVFDVEQKVRLNFHPSEAKVIAGMLIQALAQYEQQFGKVTVPGGEFQVIAESQDAAAKKIARES
jgi:hypothetical protein